MVCDSTICGSCTDQLAQLLHQINWPFQLAVNTFRALFGVSVLQPVSG